MVGSLSPVNHVITNTAIQGVNPSLGLDASLADLDKAATVRDRAETGLNEVASKGVEHDVDAATRCDPKYVVREACRSRVEHVFNADIVQQFALGLRACRGDHARAGPLRDLDSSQTDTTCRRMD